MLNLDFVNSKCLMQTVWDPLRKKEVALTPEEEVRQWFIGILKDEMRVPVHLMMSEAPICLGSKKFRVDILIWDRRQTPLAVVECKRPDVALDANVLDQTIRYNMVLNVRYIMVTNGHRTIILHRDGNTWHPETAIPLYTDMTNE
ncbi:MAG: type I restriction enzyme HsdR N-terminal domain-containing protein [Candidatus Cryptobacteroides sp.]